MYIYYTGRQRLSSLSEDCNSAPLPARARFGLSVMGGLSVRAPAHPALYLITHTGCLLHLLLHARPARSKYSDSDDVIYKDLGKIFCVIISGLLPYFGALVPDLFIRL